MSFKKSHILPSRAIVSVYRVQQYRIDYLAREASAIIAGYCDAEATVPIVPIFAKIRLEGARFDAYLSKAALRDGQDDINAAFYKAMVSDPVVCDAGADFFRDAQPA